MRNFILCSIFALSITCLFGGQSQTKIYEGVGVKAVNVAENSHLPCKKQDGAIGELNIVDASMQYKGAASVKDTAT